MLNNDVIQSLRKSLKPVTKLKFLLPFRWNKSKDRLEVATGLKESLTCILVSMLDVIFLIPVLVVEPNVVFQKNLTSGQVIVVIDHIILALMGIWIRLGFYFYRYQISAFLNTFLHYEASIRK